MSKSDVELVEGIERSIEVAESDAVKLRTLSLVSQAREIQIFDQATLTMAHDGLVQIKETRARIEEEFGPGIKQAFDHHRYLVAQKRKWTDTLDEAERELKPKIANYLAEQDRLRFDAERKAGLAKAAAAKEAEEAIDKAHDLIDQGAIDEAVATMDGVAEKAEASIAQAQAAIPAKPEAPNISQRFRWEFEIENELLIPRAFLMPNKERIKNFVSAMKEQAVIPGVRIFKKQDIAVKVPR